MKTAVWVTVSMGLFVYSCSGTETQNPSNPLVAFQGSVCKKEGNRVTNGRVATAAQELVALNYSAETRGLQCFAWEATSQGRLKVDLYNFEGACGAEWKGRAAIVDGALQLSLDNPECLVASCGWCIYDWSFEIAGVSLDAALPVSVAIDTCPGEQEIRRVLATLPVSSSNSGILCNYANYSALGWQAMSLGECGTEAMPCSGTSMCSSGVNPGEPTCSGDLACIDNGSADQRICAKACTQNEDCGTLGVLACQEGYCRPAHTW